MKILKLTSKEKLELLIISLIIASSEILAKLMGVGEIQTGLILGISRGLPLWSVYIVEFLALSTVWIVVKTVRLDMVSRLGVILLISGFLVNLVWRVLFGSITKWIDVGFISSFNLSELVIVFGALLVFLGTIWHGVK